MIFDKLFHKNSDSSKVSISVPEVAYVHTAQNRQKTIGKEFNVIVLYWISKKKQGYDKSKNNYPKWFMNKYGIDFDKVMKQFTKQGYLSEENSIVKITNAGQELLKEFGYVIYIHEHPQYCLTLDDFKNSKRLHKGPTNDIAWFVFNQRILEYTKNKMWGSLAANYANMADLLIEERKFEQAADFIFVTAYLETSGMGDNNELTPINAKCTKKGWENQYLKNGMPDIFLLEINNYYVTVPFKEVLENTNLDWPEIKVRYFSSQQIAATEKNIPFRYFEKEESFEIFKQAIEANGKKGIFRLADCKKKLRWNTPNEKSTKYFYASVENKVNRKFK